MEQCGGKSPFCGALVQLVVHFCALSGDYIFGTYFFIQHQGIKSHRKLCENDLGKAVKTLFQNWERAG